LISGRIPIEGIPNLWKQSHCIGYLEGSVDSLTLETSKESEAEPNRLRPRRRDHLQRTAGSLLLPQGERSHPPVRTACLRRHGSSGNPLMSSKRSVDADVTPTTMSIIVALLITKVMILDLLGLRITPPIVIFKKTK
jgi:hypothetical protein